MINDILVEVCCGSVDDCVIAKQCGADRIELNHALELGGMTPSVSTLKRSKELVDIPICCMVRPRGYGFNYSQEHFNVMKMEAQELLEHGADGIVFGFLNSDGTINVERTKEMVNIIKPKEAIFHKAFDATSDLEASLKILIECGVDRVLTSGGAVYPDIENGLKILQDLHERYGDKIALLPGGGVREHNVQEILTTTKLKEIHMTAKHRIIDTSTLKDSAESKNPDSHAYVATDENQLKAIMKKIGEL